MSARSRRAPSSAIPDFAAQLKELNPSLIEPPPACRRRPACLRYRQLQRRNLCRELHLLRRPALGRWRDGGTFAPEGGNGGMWTIFCEQRVHKQKPGSAGAVSRDMMVIVRFNFVIRSRAERALLLRERRARAGAR